MICDLTQFERCKELIEMGSSTALISPQKDVRDLIVELNDGFTAYYDRDLELCRASERLSQFAYGSLIPRILTKKDISLLNAGPIVVSIEKLIGYHCVLSATAIPPHSPVQSGILPAQSQAFSLNVLSLRI